MACLAAGAAQAQTHPAQASAPLSLAQVMAASRDNGLVALARSTVDAARADILAADHAPLPLLSAKLASIDLQNGIGAGNLLRDKRIDKSIGLTGPGSAAANGPCARWPPSAAPRPPPPISMTSGCNSSWPRWGGFSICWRPSNASPSWP